MVGSLKAGGGINVDPDQPGYRRIRFEPQATRDLVSVSATVGSLRGQVAPSWSHEPGVITLDVDVPMNSTAAVSIPKETQMIEITVREGDHIVWEKQHFAPRTPGVTGGKYEGKRASFEVGSGHYAFRLTGM